MNYKTLENICPMGRKTILPFAYVTLIFLSFFFSINSYGAECYYVATETSKNAIAELSSRGECGKLTDPDTFVLEKKHFKRLFFSENGLASFFYGDMAFYVSKSGKVVRTHPFDNGPDYFIEGLTRTISNGKYGFMDDQLNVVIKPEYDFAFPFKDGRAAVCDNCRIKTDGELKIITGGKWGFINTRGEVIIPIKYHREKLP